MPIKSAGEAERHFQGPTRIEETGLKASPARERRRYRLVRLEPGHKNNKEACEWAKEEPEYGKFGAPKPAMRRRQAPTSGEALARFIIVDEVVLVLVLVLVRATVVVLQLAS